MWAECRVLAQGYPRVPVTASRRPATMVGTLEDNRRRASRSLADRDVLRRTIAAERNRRDGESVRQRLAIPDGAVRCQDRRVRRSEGADPAGDRGRAAP